MSPGPRCACPPGHRRWEGTLQTAISRTQTSDWVPTPCVTPRTPAELSIPPQRPPPTGTHSSPAEMIETHSQLMDEVNWSGTARDARGQRQHLLFSSPPVTSQPSAPGRSVTGLSVSGSGELQWSAWTFSVSLGTLLTSLNLDLFHLSQSVSSVAQSHLTLCDPMNCSTPGLPVPHQLPEFTQTHVH